MNVPVELDEEKMAKACAEAMWRDDNASQQLGMKITQVGPGMATIEMTVDSRMTNGHKTCHGGYMFVLADSAFAFACNTHNQRTVAQHCSVTFLSPAFDGDRLTATAKEVQRRGRSGIYDVRITNQNGETVAEFRGHSRSVKGTLLGDAGAAGAGGEAEG